MESPRILEGAGSWQDARDALERELERLRRERRCARRLTLAELVETYRFEATQALRQVLQRGVAWGMIDVNPAKVGVNNPVRRRKEQHPFES